MRKVTLMFVLGLSLLSLSAQALDCPLKNLRKNQTRFADGTAYFPQNKKSSTHNSQAASASGSGVYRVN